MNKIQDDERHVGMAIPRQPMPEDREHALPCPPDLTRKPVSERDRAILAKRDTRKPRPMTISDLLSARMR
jgi:hypothetical protein